MGNQTKVTTCKHCGHQIAKSSKTCPSCGGKNKKPIYKRGWFIVLVFLFIIGATGGNPDNNSSSEPTESAAPSQPSTYTNYDVSDLMRDLDSNSLKAADKYKDQYVRLTGQLSVIDSSGKYISITPTGEEYAIIGVQCYINNEEQKNAIMNMSIGDNIVVIGTISDVGEVLGYTLNIDEVSKR